ncbi:Uncharacterized protein TCM_045889 [Theobroma cacao]|uniref:Uncharacterized protein n=1 Tax=Theobroma cacao TaxID=3641 RepID=S1SMF5_THECC|nr:Uncharacterized protein TCM_045889 [Theobroma cacao]
MLLATLFAPFTTSESTCGLMPFTATARVSSSKPEGYQEMKSNAKELKTDVHDVKSNMNGILERPLDPTGGSSSSQ